MKRRAIKQNLDWCHRTKPILGAMIQFRWTGHHNTSDRHVHTSKEYKTGRSVCIYMIDLDYSVFPLKLRTIEPTGCSRKIGVKSQVIRRR